MTPLCMEINPRFMPTRTNQFLKKLEQFSLFCLPSKKGVVRLHGDLCQPLLEQFSLYCLSPPNFFIKVHFFSFMPNDPSFFLLFLW